MRSCTCSRLFEAGPLLRGLQSAPAPAARWDAVAAGGGQAGWQALSPVAGQEARRACLAGWAASGYHQGGTDTDDEWAELFNLSTALLVVRRLPEVEYLEPLMVRDAINNKDWYSAPGWCCRCALGLHATGDMAANPRVMQSRIGRFRVRRRAAILRCMSEGSNTRSVQSGETNMIESRQNAALRRSISMRARSEGLRPIGIKLRRCCLRLAGWVLASTTSVTSVTCRWREQLPVSLRCIFSIIRGE